MFDPPHTRTRDLSGRVPELDGLRAIAVLITLAYHLRLPGDTGLAVVDAWNSFVNLGWSGVDLFFVLSGFLITGILLRTREGSGYFRNFYARRFLRIFPLYYAMIAILFFGVRLVPYFGQFNWFWKEGSENWWYYPLFLANFSEGIGYTKHSSFAVAWSLCVEEQFYLVWPLIVLRYRPRTLCGICIGMIVCSTGLRWFLLGPFGGNRQLVPWLAPCRMDGLAVGALVAVAVQSRLLSDRALHRLGRLGAALLVPACVWMLWRQAVQPPDDRSAGQDYAVLCWGYLFVALGFGAMLALALFRREDGRYSRLLRSAPLVSIGKYSYAIYLVHYPVYVALAKCARAEGLPVSGLAASCALIAATLAITWILALLSWRLLEKPCLDLKRHFEYGADRAAVPETKAA